MTHKPQWVIIAYIGQLIGLVHIVLLDLLRRLFGAGSVTSWVAEEILEGGDFPDLSALKVAFAQPWRHTLNGAKERGDTWAEARRALINLHQIDMKETGDFDQG